MGVKLLDTESPTINATSELKSEYISYLDEAELQNYGPEAQAELPPASAAL